MKHTVSLLLLPLLASQLCLVEGVRNRYRARIGLRRHRHPEPDQDEHRHRDTDTRDLGARGVRRHLEEEEEHELLEGAENGRYKVIAKAEPYKNLPPAPVTPEGDFYPVTPAPAPSHVTSSHRSYEPTPKPKEELKFALLDDAKTQKYVPVRQTPAYQPTTPRYSVTPPAIEFEPTPAELVGKKSKSSKTKPQHGRFKISVDDEDVNNFQPDPPPTTPPPPPPPKVKKEPAHQQKHQQHPKRPKPTPVHKLHSPAHKNTAKGDRHMRPKAKPGAQKPKQKNSSAYFVSKDGPARDEGLITNEIESGSLEKNKVQIVSKSIYDPRRSRSYKKNYNSNSYKRERILKKYNYRKQHNTKNYNLPIRDHQKTKKSKSKTKAKPLKESKTKAFDPEVPGYQEEERNYETVKRNPQTPLIPALSPAPEPIFFSSKPAPVPVKSQHLPAPARAALSPFTAFPASPAPAVRTTLTTMSGPVTPPPPSPTPPLVQFSPVQHFASFAPIDHHAPAPKPHFAPPRPPPAPAPHPRPAPGPFHSPPPPPAPVHHRPAPLHTLPHPAPVHPLPHHAEFVEEDYQPKPYSYNFGVNDEYSGVDYNRAEERSDSGVTRGSYTVLLPDGRIQTVSYVADDDGFHATVSYEGEPSHPEPHAPGPVVHHAAPASGHFKPSNRYRASNKVARPGDTKFVSPTPAPIHHTTPAPLLHSTPVPHRPVPSPLPLVKQPVLAKDPVPLGPPVKEPVPIGPPVKDPLLLGPVVKELPYSPHTPTVFTPTPSPYTPTTTAYSPYTASPFPNFSPSPTPFFYSPTPPPYQYGGSPTPPPHPIVTTPAPHDVTPAPIFHTSTPGPLVLGLKASHPPPFNLGAGSNLHLSHSLPIRKRHDHQDSGYIEPTTWKPKYPKILEHTLRSAPSETYYGHRIKKGVKDEDKEWRDDEYDY